jgi:methyltransferase family protein
MYSTFRLAGKYLHYYLTAANGRGHGIHSPFVFEFVTKVLNDKRAYPEYAPIERLRDRLRRDPTLLEIEDLGAGPVNGAAHTRSVGSIARHAAKPSLLGQLLFRVARHYKPSTILELGTSLGLSAAYLSSGAPQARLYTIEGAPALAAAAGANLHSLGIDIRPITGNFDAVLPGLLAGIPPIELAFVDGNHRFEPTLRYFEMILTHAGGGEGVAGGRERGEGVAGGRERGERAAGSVLIFDDIHWSAEMEAAWAAIKGDPRVYLTVDLFFLGFVFLRDAFKVKQHFAIRF